jgi:hypothetical protein
MISAAGTKKPLKEDGTQFAYGSFVKKADANITGHVSLLYGHDHIDELMEETTQKYIPPPTGRKHLYDSPCHKDHMMSRDDFMTTCEDPLPYRKVIYFVLKKIGRET